MIESLRQLADRFGSKPFITWVSDGSTTGYDQLSELAGRWATLLAEHGVSTGDRVLLLLDNDPNFLGAYFGTQILGALSVPINVELRGDSLRYYVELYKPRVVVVEHYLTTILDAINTSVEFRTITVPVLTMESLTPRYERGFRDSDPCLIMSTSGTTGPSKGSLWTHGTVYQWAAGYRRHLGYGVTDRIFSCTPLFHANSLIAGVATAQHAGAGVVLGRRFSVSNFWRQVADSKATSTNLLGAMIEMLLKDESDQSARDRERSTLRTLLVSSLSATAHRAVEATWKLTPVTAYGLTDFGTVLSTTDGIPAPPGSVGKPVEEFELRLVDSGDRDVPVGTAGELVGRPQLPWITPLGYFEMPAETVSAQRNYWFHTGDLLRQDDQGWYYFAGRIKDSMRRRGENVSAHEVEAAVLTFPGIVEAAAYSIPADEGEDEIAVAVAFADRLYEPDFKQFFAHVSAQLPYFAVPRYVRVMDSLPRTPSYRVQKDALRKQGLTADIWDRVAAGVDVVRNRRE